MNKRRKIWLAVSVAVVIIFLWGIPLDVYESASIFYSCTGAVLLFISLFQFFGDFQSLDEVLEKIDKSKPQPAGRNFAPFMVLPAFIFLFISFVYYGNKKSTALETNGFLTKGIVLNGESKNTTRRMRTTTSYELHAKFVDSSGTKHHFYQSVSAAEFNSMYQGAQVDIVYWRENPEIARIVFDVTELSKYKKIPNESITINNLTSILDGKITEDSITNYLNSINYEWVNSEKNVYQNSKLNLIIQYSKEENRVAYIETNPAMGYTVSENGMPPFSFDQDLIAKGYKKQASAGENGKEVELYYSDSMLVQKTRSMEATEGVGLRMYNIYLISKVSKQ